MGRPPLGTAPTVDDLVRLSCPVERAAAVTKLVAEFGTLPRTLADLRKTDLRTARESGYTLRKLAAKVGLSHGRVCQLSKVAAAEGPPS